MIMANHNYKEMVSLTENWFDNATDRMAGWYRRKMQAIGLVIAILLTISVNADSIALVKYLYMNPQVRDQIAEIASRPETLNSLPSEKNPKELLKRMDELALPLGWKDEIARLDLSQRSGSSLDFLDKCALGLELAGTHFFGWLLTIFAISLGAPFWFDLLKKFVNIRAAGKALNDEFKGKQKET